MYFSALLGHPVEHSISPRLFGILADMVGVEYAHLKIDVPSTSQLDATIRALIALGFRGVNVTLPYKLDVIGHCVALDEKAKQIGAVNTLVFRDSDVWGYNTDSAGALRAIERMQPLCVSDTVLVLGAGGAARAIVYALASRCGSLTVLHPRLTSAQKLVHDLALEHTEHVQCEQLTPDTLGKNLAKATLIVNATPVGMYPNMDNRIIPLPNLNKAARQCNFSDKRFFDAIFNPFHTHFLLDAAHHGARICSGMDMMIFQATEAFRLWTSFDVSDQVDIESISSTLKSHVHILG